jgi:hypothetical protein
MLVVHDRISCISSKTTIPQITEDSTLHNEVRPRGGLGRNVGTRCAYTCKPVLFLAQLTFSLYFCVVPTPMCVIYAHCSCPSYCLTPNDPPIPNDRPTSDCYNLTIQKHRLNYFLFSYSTYSGPFLSHHVDAKYHILLRLDLVTLLHRV